MRPVTIAAVLGLGIAGLGWATMPYPVTAPNLVVEIPELPELDDWLTAAEQRINDTYGLVPGTEKRIRWQVPGEKTGVAVVYLHGYSASRQETAPLPETLADALHANLFETRLSGHGHQRAPMAGVTAEHWIRDAAEAIAVGSRIGDRVIVFAVSTGATAVMALHGSPVLEPVTDIILMSPNFRPVDPASGWVTGPFGPQLTRLIAGSERSWEPRNEAQGRYWTTRYPTDAVIEVMRLVDEANRKLPAEFDQRILTLVSLHDRVVSAEITLDAFEMMNAPDKELVLIDAIEGTSNHVLAGDIVAPGNTASITATILRFLRRPAP